MKTYSIRPFEIDKKWYIINAEGLVLGRLASVISSRLRGKHKPGYTPHMDCGDNIIVINAGKVHLTGKKLKDKLFYWHTGYPGGIKSQSSEIALKSKHPERLLQRAVRRMVPRGPLGRTQLKNLKIFPGAEHSHEAQQPESLDVAAMNSKNKKRR
jgi:large subunit ribosomal protein L13